MGYSLVCQPKYSNYKANLSRRKKMVKLLDHKSRGIELRLDLKLLITTAIISSSSVSTFVF